MKASTTYGTTYGPPDWGRQDIHAEQHGQVEHVTRYKYDGPGRRRMPVDQLRDDGVISEDCHIAAQRFIKLLALCPPRMTQAEYGETPSTPGPRSLCSDESIAAHEGVQAANSAVQRATGIMGLGLLTRTLAGETLADIAKTKGYTRGLGRGDATRMHSQIRDAYDALAAHFTAIDKSTRRGA